jgi:hypothetical protein
MAFRREKEKRALWGGGKSANAQHSVILTRRSAQALTHSLYAFIGSASEVAFLRGESIEVEITTDSHATKSFSFSFHRLDGAVLFFNYAFTIAALCIAFSGREDDSSMMSDG